MTDALAYARDHADAFVDQLTDWLRIPSVSTDPDHDADTRRAAEWLAADLRRIGMTTVEVMETGTPGSPGHPVVFAERLVDASKPTVLVYGHYDVQPPDPLELWTSPALRAGRQRRQPRRARLRGRQGAGVHARQGRRGVPGRWRRAARKP